MSTGIRDRFREDLLQWAETNLRDFLWRSPDRTFYEVFVAEFFLTQTPPQNVADIYPTFLERFPSLRAIDEVATEELERVIEPLGFQRMRSEALSQIAAEYDELPRNPEQLQTLPRVGPYVANATVCFACFRPLPVIDRNVIRVYGRVFESFPDGEDERRRFVQSMLPEDGNRARRYNLALIDFGSLLCTKRDPKCAECVASNYCNYYTMGRQ